ncbi:CBS domain-containing protein [Roseomonas sp. SSH11]|uniref:CBS domain-containing protein n=1 Tax=Pararoseomonas baculiformis TaxID=2820812 RepID=A0ABS4AMT0_9PROT|nr:CBS domain-containing protein [Pararoseomonas baculiformis]MBP0447865.1 CBS domain-containing protein [Pararoseomonas baculiformis]
MQMLARDLMDPDVVTVPPGVPAADIARMFADRGISTVAVVDHQGALEGIVTEADLIRRLVDEDERPRAGWLTRVLANPNIAAERYARSHGRTAGDLMTKKVVTVGPEDSAAHIARLMEEHKIRRVLVTTAGRLLGLVSRSALVRALVEPASGLTVELSDEDIRRAVLAAMRREEWANTGNIAVGVREGVVEFSGYRQTETIGRALRVLAENVPGVKQVVDRTLLPPVVFSP